jgi:hypothetical protein
LPATKLPFAGYATLTADFGFSDYKLSLVEEDDLKKAACSALLILSSLACAAGASNTQMSSARASSVADTAATNAGYDL